MEMVVQIAVSDLVSRLIARVIHRYQEWENVGQKLRRMHLTLTSIHASIEEAKQRCITNQLILLQLKTFMEVVWQAYYLLESFESEGSEEDSGHDEVRNPYSFSLSNPCKRVRRITDCVKRLLLGDMSKLQEVMGLLDAVSANLQQFDAIVAGYPRRSRRPYDSYMYADKCMFGRHVEREQIINFLFEKDDNFASQILPVLPIIGRHRSGKKTLMENVCSDERVRGHFSLIFLLDGDDLEGEMLEAPFLACREGVTITNHDLQLKKCLLVIEFAFSVDVESWTMFYRRANNLMKGTGSKIMIFSTLKEVARLGTTSSITLMPLPPEQFWYFFKAIAFGSANPKEHPKLLSLGMQVANATSAGFIRAQIYGSALRNNLDVNAWSIVLGFVRKGQRGHAFYRRHNRVISLHTITGLEESHSCILRRSRVDIMQGKLPHLNIHDLWNPKVAIPPGETEIVLWRSILPPYRVFIGTVIPGASAERKQRFAASETLEDMEDKIFRMYQPKPTFKRMS